MNESICNNKKIKCGQLQPTGCKPKKGGWCCIENGNKCERGELVDENWCKISKGGIWCTQSPPSPPTFSPTPPPPSFSPTPPPTPPPSSTLSLSFNKVFIGFIIILFLIGLKFII